MKARTARRFSTAIAFTFRARIYGASDPPTSRRQCRAHFQNRSGQLRPCAMKRVVRLLIMKPLLCLRGAAERRDGIAADDPFDQHTPAVHTELHAPRLDRED